MHAEPQKEHRWLQQLLGEWTFETTCPAGPGMPPAKLTGSESVRSLGGNWMICEGQHEMPDGGVGLSIMSLGYDPAKKRFVGSFIGSMMHNIWIYDGALDPTEKLLILETDGPSFTDPSKTAKYQDIIEIKSADHRVLSSQFLGDDGTWTRFMEAHYQRKN